MTAIDPNSERSGNVRVPRALASGLHLAIGFVPYLGTGLVAPKVGVYVLAVIWFGLFVAVWRWRPANPWLLLGIPVIGLAAWFAVVAGGDAWLGWTA